MNYMHLSLSLTLTIILSLSTVKLAFAEDDPAEISIGERLFLETRFAQAYYANPNLADPIMQTTLTSGKSLESPFAGKTMNCRACHLVDEYADQKDAGMRSYTDYVQRPAVPQRNDNLKTSLRNSMSMVNISNPGADNNTVFHADGEFNSLQDLVKATLSGRNFGWMVTEKNIAFKHIANIIRKDDGKGSLAAEFGGAYSSLLSGRNKNLVKQFRLPSEYRINVKNASDEEIVDAVAKLIAAYVSDLGFSRDEHGSYNASPYDQFLKINNLPQKENKNESLADYNQRLINAVNKLKNPRFVKNHSTKFVSHKQAFVFAELELKGMKLFFNPGSTKQAGGNCASCHTAPHFSDFAFHNTGINQQNYDGLHGPGAFSKLSIPSLSQRNKQYNAYLPATTKHPKATSRFRSFSTNDQPGYTDLGLWNVFANPDMPAPQKKLQNILCSQIKNTADQNCKKASLLEKSIAAFKTPVLRDLGHSNPYMHTGQFSNLKQTVEFYISISILAKNNLLRNPAPALINMQLSNQAVLPLVAFLKSLNEDYD